MPDDEREAWMTRLPPELANEVDNYREERGLNKSEAVRDLTDAGLRAQEEEGPIERAFFVMGVFSAVMALWFFFVANLAVLTVRLSDLFAVDSSTVAAVFGILAAAWVLTFAFVFSIRRYGLAALFDRYREEPRYIDP